MRVGPLPRRQRCGRRFAASASRETPKGNVRLRISIGVHSGTVEALLVGDSHRELLVTGPAITKLVEAEGAASAGQILVSAATAEFLPTGCLGEPVGPGFLLKRTPSAPSSRLEMLEDAPADLLPLTLRDELVGGGQPPEHRLISVAFLHLQGVDELVSDPTALTRAVDTSVAIVQRHLDEHAVTFLSSDVYDDGFKIIAVAGAPTSRGDDEERLLRAVQAAISDPDLPLPARAGAHRGTAFVGAVGAPHRATYTVMGDTVNTAARVMSRAGRGQLLATPSILERSATTFVVTPIEPFMAKGKSKPLEASIVGPPSGVRARELARLPLAGRDTERTQLLDAWDAAAAGLGGKVEIIGDAGIGKSRLIAEVIAAARDGGATVLQVQAEPYQQATAHFVTALLLRRLGDERPLLLEGSGFDLTNVLAERLADALGQQRRLIVVEDGDHVDDASREVLGAVEIAERPHLIVRAARMDGPTLAGASVIKLDPVSDQAIASVVAATRGRRGVLPDRLRAITALAGGNPQHAIELAKAPDEGELPDSIESAVASRIDSLPPDRRTRLRELSILGTRFDLSIASELIGGAKYLDELDEHIARSEQAARFRSSVERDAAYAGLSYKRRRNLHQRAADLIAAAADDPDDVAEELSLHYHEAGDAASVLRFARRAARRAEERQSTPPTAVHYGRALAAARRLQVSDAERAELLLGYLIGCRYAGRAEEALAAERELRRLHIDAMTELRITLFLAELAHDRGQFARARRLARRGIDRSASARDDREVAGQRLVCYMQIALSSQALGDSREARRAAQQAAVLADELGDDHSQARALAIRGSAESDDLEASRLLDAAAAIYRRLDQLFAAAVVLNNGGNRLARIGRDDDAMERYTIAADLLTAHGEDLFAAVVRTNVIPLEFEHGNWGAARDLAHELIPLVEAAGFMPAFVPALANLARTQAALGETDDATATLAQFMTSLHDGHADDIDRIIASEALLLLGRGQDARPLLDAVDDKALSGHLVGNLRLRLVRWWVGLQTGQDNGDSLERVANDAGNAGIPTVEAIARVGLGQMEVAVRRLEETGISRVAVPPKQPGDPVEILEAVSTEV